jgi:O-antigen/teichoic acid export membrane protein
VALVIAVVRTGGSLLLVLGCYLLANLVAICAAAGAVARSAGAFRPSWNPAQSSAVIRGSFAFFVLGLLEILHLKVDTLMLFALGSASAVAAYEAAFKLFEVSQLAVRPVAMVFFPIAAGLAAARDWVGFAAVLRKLLAISAAAGTLAAIVVLVGAGRVVPLVWGSAYADSVPVLQVLYLAVPALFVSFVIVFLANALHLERAAIRVLAWGLVANLALNSVAIPAWGPIGAAATTLLTQSFIAIWLTLLVIARLRSATSADAPTGRAPQPVI